MVMGMDKCPHCGSRNGEKLVELLRNMPVPEITVFGQRCGKALVTAEFIADHLIANGVIVPPVKIGQKVYTIPRSAIREWTVCGVWISADPKCSYAHIYWEKNGHHMESRAVNFSDISRCLFLSREEVEKALEERMKAE